MKVVILAGGLGTRLSEETEIKPKPMVEIGGQPIIWHIMKHYAHFGFKEFCIALGYRGELVKRFFLDYHSLNGNISIDLASGNVDMHERECEDWVVHLQNTGQDTNTGGRVKRLESQLNDGTFMITYGDSVCDVNLHDLLEFHRAHGRIGTITAVRPPARFGGLISMATVWWLTSPKNRRSERAGSTAASWSASRRFSIISRTMTAVSRLTRWSSSHPSANSRRTNTRASGSVWTPCATSVFWKTCGRMDALPGNYGILKLLGSLCAAL